MTSGEQTLATIGKILRIALIVYAISLTAAWVLTLIGMLWSRSLRAVMDALVIATGALSLLQLATFIASFVLVALWVFRGFANLRDAGLQGLNYSPGWATASFFVPFVNMLVPMRVLRELHNRSHGESDWHAAQSVGDVTSWYACNWAAFVMFCFIVTVIAVDQIPGVFVMTPDYAWAGMFALFGLFLAGSAWFLSQVVRQATAAQLDGLHLSQTDVFD